MDRHNSSNNSSFNDQMGTIGSWNAPETNAFGRSGWNSDGSSRGEAVLDDGTAIWGNPSVKKTGIDWTEKDSQLNPPLTNNNNKNSEKRIQRTEPIISSINGTEAWGAPAAITQTLVAPNNINNNLNSNNNKQQNINLGAHIGTNNNNSNKNNSTNLSNNIKQQTRNNSNDISGNTYANNIINNSNKLANSTAASLLGWGVVPEPSSSSSPQATTSVTNENSSLPSINSVWNNPVSINNIINDSKLAKSTSDWSSSSNPSNNHAASNVRLSELADQLESTDLFDTGAAISSSISSSSSTTTTISSIVKNAASCTNDNLNLENLTSSIGGANINSSNAFVTCNALNDLKQMSANFTSKLLFDSPGHNGNSPSSSSSSSTTTTTTTTTSNNQQSHPLDSATAAAAAAAAAAYSATAAAAGPSRDLLKQMVRQIQLAVQAGHLNAHILNQPFSTPTLQLVYQLLQQIKILQQLQEIQRSGEKSNELSSPRSLDLQINRVRQNISLLQGAITQQQQQQQVNKNDNIVSSADLNNGAVNYSYATISKLSTKKVPSAKNMSNLINNSNLDSFRRSSLIDTMSNSNSDLLRSAQATFDANAIIDKTLPSLIRAPTDTNNILSNLKGDFPKAQCFTSGISTTENQHAGDSPPSRGGLLAPQSATPASSNPSSAWSFSSGDFVTPGWSRISSDIPQDQQNKFNPSSDDNTIKQWRGSSISSNLKDNDSTLMAPGANLNLPRPNSASNNSKSLSLNENDILARSATSFYNWSENSNSDKRSFEAASSFNPSTIGGFSLQSNPWLFPPTSSSLNMGSGLDSLSKTQHSNDNNSRLSDSSPINKHDNGVTNINKSVDPLNFMRPTNDLMSSIQRSAQSGLYNWNNMTSSSLQFNLESGSSGKLQPETSTAPGPSSSSGGGRPAPPPGLMNSFAPMAGNNNSSSSGISLFDSKSNLAGLNPHLQSREPTSSLWSGSWFD